MLNAFSTRCAKAQETCMARKNDPHQAPEAERGEDNTVSASNTPAQASGNATSSKRSSRKASASVENTIDATNAREAWRTSVGRREPAEDRGTNPRAVPEEIEERYIHLDGTYHFLNGDPAFVDRGNGLSTKLENPEIIRDMLAIARERGWQEVTLGGSDRFRKAAWMEAKAAGLEVRGYEPTALDKAQLVRSLNRQRQTEGESKEAPSAPPRSQAREAQRSPETQSPEPQPAAASDRAAPRAHRGRLVAHGADNFEFNRKEPPSYFVTLETPQGEQTLWGVDLERAFRESLSQPKKGEEVEVRHLGSQPVTVTRRRRGDDGQVYEEPALVTHRNSWKVETREFFAERDKAAQVLRDTTIDPKKATAQRPELAGTYVELQAAKLAAPKLYETRADQQRFLERFRETLAREIEAGEPLSDARLPGRAKRQQREEARSQRLAQERVLT
jgi:Large polyvalent protein-associated domain 7